MMKHHKDEMKMRTAHARTANGVKLHDTYGKYSSASSPFASAPASTAMFAAPAPIICASAFLAFAVAFAGGATAKHTNFGGIPKRKTLSTKIRMALTWTHATMESDHAA